MIRNWQKAVNLQWKPFFKNETLVVIVNLCTIL